MIKNPPTSPLAQGAQMPSREAILQAVERTATMGLASVDVNGRQSYVSPAFCAMVGWSAEELIGQEAPFAYWPSADSPALGEVCARAAAGDVPPSGFELRFRQKSGETFFVQLLVTPISEDGAAAGWLLSIFDLTVRKQLESEETAARLQRLESERQQMRAARAEAETANRSKDLFLAMLGHELRNPLSPILTALELMRLRGSEESFKERSIIERQVKHLVRLVDDLLDVSRITRGKIELTREPIEIADVLTRAIEIASPLLEQHNHYLSVLVPRKGLQVHGDSARLAQVFANLITNSAKYSQAGSQIFIAGRREGDQIVVAVKDSGQGIDAQLLPYVFDLFSQGERTIDRSQGGLGIGLTLVRSLVQLHGGTATAASAGKGAGSEFQVRLPALEQAAPASSAPVSAARLPAAAPQRSLRVLVVDDNVDAAQLLFEALGMMGYKARVAHDGPSGLQAAIEFKPDVAFLDIGLPVMDGYELARRLLEWSSTVHLIAITGYGQDSDRKRSREAGFAQHLVKPLDLKRFRAILDELEKHKRSQEA